VTIVENSVTDQLSADFTRACAELANARRLMRTRDSIPHRAAVTEWERAVDVLLDMLLQVRLGPAPGLTGPTPATPCDPQRRFEVPADPHPGGSALR
jgi:hypothetical protein